MAASHQDSDTLSDLVHISLYYKTIFSNTPALIDILSRSSIRQHGAITCKHQELLALNLAHKDTFNIIFWFKKFGFFLSAMTVLFHQVVDIYK